MIETLTIPEVCAILRIGERTVYELCRTGMLAVRDFDFGQPGFAQTSSTYSLATWLALGGPPA